VTYKKDGRTLAVVTISRDLQSLQAEAAMEGQLPSQRHKVGPDGIVTLCDELA
jgi:hypothetical protein